MQKHRLTTNEAVEMLQALRCGDDPVFVQNSRGNIPKNKEIRVDELEEFRFVTKGNGSRPTDFIPAFKVMLKFYCGDGWVMGSLQDLVICRLRDIRGFDKMIRLPKLKKSEGDIPIKA